MSTRTRKYKRWTDEEREAAIREVCGLFAHFPSRQELESIGRMDLIVQIGKSGGFIHWSERIGIARPHSDSDTGWEGEVRFAELCERQGISCERMTPVKHPFDLMAGGILRIDVKAARFAKYNQSSGWFYRIAKAPQADLIALYQLDTGEFYALPWWRCPQTNVSISRDGGKYADCRNNWSTVRQMISLRAFERAMGGPVAEVA
jgi:hypothetical protein